MGRLSVRVAFMTLVALATLAMPASAWAPASPTHAQDRTTSSATAGCEPAEGGLTVCNFAVDTQQDLSTSFFFPLPNITRALGQLTIRFDGQDQGWEIAFVHNRSQVSYAVHSPANYAEAQAHVSDTTVHLLINETEPDAWTLFLHPDEFDRGDLRMNYVAGSDTGRSTGRFAITFVEEPLPYGTPPVRPAANADVPQLRDTPFDSSQAGTDIRAAWLSDANLGDGLLDAHMKLRSLENLTLGNGSINYVFEFEVRGVRYFVSWGVYQLPRELRAYCILGDYVTGHDEVLARIPCTLDIKNGTLDASFPERSIGDPSPQELFTNFSAHVYVFSRSSFTAASLVTGTSVEDDRASGQRFAFAVGGPDVWDHLNGCAFCPPKAAWWRDPLAAENLPNTLQVLGAIVASVSFLGGFILVRKNRRQTKELLARVDALVDLHERDAGGALAELGALENEFAKLYREGRINESQYQVVTQRVVGAASRFALRRELGMESTRNVPVRGPRSEARLSGRTDE